MLDNWYLLCYYFFMTEQDAESKSSSVRVRDDFPPLPSGWLFNYSSPEDPHVPMLHFNVCLLKIANPAFTAREIAVRLGLKGPDGNPTLSQLQRISRILLHAPNAEWMRESSMRIFGSPGRAVLEATLVQREVLDTVLQILRTSESDTIRLRAIDMFYRYFGSPDATMFQRGLEGGGGERLKGDPMLDDGTMLDVLASVGGESSDDDVVPVEAVL